MLLCLGEPLVRFLCCCSFLMRIFICRCSSFCCCLFFIHFQATLPCHRHSTLASQAREGLQQLWALPQLLLIAFSFSSTASATVFEWAFFTNRRFLPYAPSHNIFGRTCFYQGLPGSRQLFLEVCRASYWSLKHRTGPSVCLIHSNPQCFINLKFVFMHVDISKVILVAKTLMKNIDQQPHYSAAMKI